MNQIREDMEVEELLEKHPEVIPLLTTRGIICIQCGAPVWGTIGETIERTGQDINEVVSQLNSAIGKLSENKDKS